MRAAGEAGYESETIWKGHRVTLTDGDAPCEHREPDGSSAVVVMHHHDGDSQHYCPTGIIYCYRCFASGDEPGEPACTLWGKPATAATETPWA